MTLSGQRRTEIIRELVTTRLQRLTKVAESIYPDGMLPGDFKLPPDQEFQQLWARTEPTDYSKIANPEYESLVRTGVITDPPVSPYWLNLLSVPGLFKQQAKRYMELIDRYAAETAG